jgi:DNA-binding CsgD family transcriptional regulator
MLPFRKPSRFTLGGPVIENVILSIGKAEFGDVLFDAFHREMRVRQVVLHHFHDDVTVETLAAKDDRQDGCVHSLVRDYVRRYHIYDPFRSRCMPAASRSVELQGFAVKEVAETEYSQKLFVEPGIAGKICVILRRPADAICLSLYRDRSEGSFDGEDMHRIDAIKSPLAAAFERHLDLRPQLPPLKRIAALLENVEEAALSAREAAVCARIVTGYSNEAIAIDLGLSFHSVRTYRRRAYAKLQVTSQNELFALILHGGKKRSLGD